MKKHNSDEIEVIKVFLSKNEHPIAYEAKMRELMNESGMTEDEAELFLQTTPFELELYYSYNQGLFGVESEAVTDCDIINPYNGEFLEENNEF